MDSNLQKDRVTRFQITQNTLDEEISFVSW